jgi:hypothetical protein
MQNKMENGKRKEKDEDCLDNDNDNDNDPSRRNVKCKIKKEFYNGALSEPTPDGVKRYIYHEHIQRTVDAPRESQIYTEWQLRELLTEAIAVYQMLYFIRNRKQRLCFVSCYLNRLWHMETFGHQDDWKGSDCFFFFYANPLFKEDEFEMALTALFESTRNPKLNEHDQYKRIKVLIDIFNKINTSHVERDI